jgi:hypothetical protein
VTEECVYLDFLTGTLQPCLASVYNGRCTYGHVQPTTAGAPS